MCIRDSDNDDDNDYDNDVDNDDDNDDNNDDDNDDNNDDAVSYTHLRAHETKANLVCRLLLEKKKIKCDTKEEFIRILRVCDELLLPDQVVYKELATQKDK